jgi:PAS domain S-box-containing protein
MLLNVASEILMSIDTAGTIRVMNESGHRVLGYRYPELKGKNWFDTCLPEDVREDVRRYLRHLQEAETDEVRFHENEVVTKTGVRRLISWRDTLYRDSNGRVIGSYGAGKDITDSRAAEKMQKHLEEHLREKSELLGSITDNMFDLVALTDLSGNLQFVGGAAMLGYDRQSVIGINIMDLVHPEDLFRLKEEFEQFLQTRKPFTVEYRYRKADGMYLWLETHGKYLDGGAGKKHNLIFSTRNINDRKEAEKAQIELAKAAEKLNGFTADTVDYQLIAETMGELSGARYTMMNVHEKNGKDFTTVAFAGLPYIVEKATALVGFPLVGKNWIYSPAWDEKEDKLGDRKTVVFPSFADLVSGILPVKVIKLVSATFNNGPAVIVKTSRDERILGRFVLLFEKGTNLRNRSVVESFADMVGMLLYRIEIEERNSALIREKENLLKEVHHRIKNNMSTMGSMLSLHADSLDSGSDAVAVLNEAKSRLRSMEVLYDQLYRDGEHDGGSIREYLLHLVYKIIELFPAGELVTVSTEIEDFYLDAKTLSTLGMIVNELVTNAMKYAFKGRPDGRLSIHVRREGEKAALTIEDDGPGLPRGFDMADPPGFGTLMVKALSQQIDGIIRVERAGGTRFILEFPPEPQ